MASLKEATVNKFILAASLVLAIVAMGCGGPYVKTREMVVYLEKNFNQGQLLPVDVIYIADPNDYKEILGIGPDAWFDHPKRFGWTQKRMLKFKQGDYVKLSFDLSGAKKMKYIVVFADFIHLQGAKGQQVVFDPKKAEKIESVFLAPNGLLH